VTQQVIKNRQSWLQMLAGVLLAGLIISFNGVPGFHLVRYINLFTFVSGAAFAPGIFYY